MSECSSKVLYLVAGSLVSQQEDLGEPAILGVLVTRRHVFDPPSWCGAATTSFVRGTWRPPSLVEKLLSGTRGQDDRECSRKRLGGREAIFFVSASTTWM